MLGPSSAKNLIRLPYMVAGSDAVTSTLVNLSVSQSPVAYIIPQVDLNWRTLAYFGILIAIFPVFMANPFRMFTGLVNFSDIEVAIICLLPWKQSSDTCRLVRQVKMVTG